MEIYLDTLLQNIQDPKTELVTLVEFLPQIDPREFRRLTGKDLKMVILQIVNEYLDNLEYEDWIYLNRLYRWIPISLQAQIVLKIENRLIDAIDIEQDEDEIIKILDLAKTLGIQIEDRIKDIIIEKIINLDIENLYTYSKLLKLFGESIPKEFLLDRLYYLISEFSYDKNQIKNIKAVLETGINPNEYPRDADYGNFILLAERYGKSKTPQIVKLLEKYGADRNIRHSPLPYR